MGFFDTLKTGIQESQQTPNGFFNTSNLEDFGVPINRNLGKQFTQNPGGGLSMQQRDLGANQYALDFQQQAPSAQPMPQGPLNMIPKVRPEDPSKPLDTSPANYNRPAMAIAGGVSLLNHMRLSRLPPPPKQPGT